jgi:NitT/TauT family transport system permease protein
MADLTSPIALISKRAQPNLWDAVAFGLIIGLLAAVAHNAHGTVLPISAVEQSKISLSPWALPGYAMRTVMRMMAAMIASLVFTFTFAPLAAKSRRAGQIMIPLLDILQSVPILGFLTFTVTAFMALFPGSVLGLEFAAIFVIFTSQAWNMTFSFYQSLSTIPRDLNEAATNFQLSPWQRFWRLEVPIGMPGLVWNAMMSMSGGWFFVVASEAITVGTHTIALPGIGSYVATALDGRDLGAVAWAIVAMGLVILAYDQLLFRPLVAWADKFKFEQTASEAPEDPWALKLVQRTRLMRAMLLPMQMSLGYFARLRIGKPRAQAPIKLPRSLNIGFDVAWYSLIVLGLGWCLWRMFSYMAQTLHFGDLLEAVELGVITFVRVIALIILASIVWVPIGVWIGLRPALSRRVQSFVQFAAAFPANLLFPIAVVLIVRFHGNADIWLSPLMILGTQWYILFNVIAGASVFPGDLREASANFGIKGWRWWRKVMLPGIFPYYVTGAITASGGSWNASILAEVVNWGPTRLHAHGLGAYIEDATQRDDPQRVVLGVAVMCAFVIATNRILWRPLYEYAGRRLRFD